MILNMFKEFFKKNPEEKNNKRQIENIVFFIIILIVTVLIINNMWSSGDKKDNKENTTSSKTLAKNYENETQDNLEKKLEEILESINGVGKVKVLIKYSESSTVVAMYNETKAESLQK